MSKEKMVIIYTDGGAHRNPGPGAWAAILHFQGQKKSVAGFEPDTTNNRMELMAAIQGLTALTRTIPVEVVTDSQYLKNGITQWIHNWKRQGWKTANKDPVKNQDLWEALDVLCQKHTVTWSWVKGHSGHPLNDEVDALVQKTIEENKT